MSTNPDMPKLATTPTEALEFLLERLDPMDGIERLVDGCTYDERRAERAYLLSMLRASRRVLKELREQRS